MCVATLAGCTATGVGESNGSARTSVPTDNETVTDAATDPFPDPDLSASNTCGQVTAYVSVISNALMNETRDRWMRAASERVSMVRLSPSAIWIPVTQRSRPPLNSCRVLPGPMRPLTQLRATMTLPARRSVRHVLPQDHQS